MALEDGSDTDSDRGRFGLDRAGAGAPVPPAGNPARRDVRSDGSPGSQSDVGFRGRMTGTARIYLRVLAEMRRHAWRLDAAIAEVLLISALEVLKPWPL